MTPPPTPKPLTEKELEDLRKEIVEISSCRPTTTANEIFYSRILTCIREHGELKGSIRVGEKYRYALEQIQNEAGQGADRKELARIAHDAIWGPDTIQEIKRLRAGQAREKILRDALKDIRDRVDPECRYSSTSEGIFLTARDAIKQADALKGIE